MRFLIFKLPNIETPSNVDRLRLLQNATAIMHMLQNDTRKIKQAS